MNFSQTAQTNAMLGSSLYSRGSPGPLSPNYGANDIWLEIEDTNAPQTVDLTLHNPTVGLNWQLISDNFGPTNLFQVVATNIPNAVGIDYDVANQSLILPINFNDNSPATFGILHTNAVLANWSGISGVDVGFEVRIATVKTTTNGFTAGDLLFGNGNSGGIGWLSADGTTSNLNWIVITNEPNLVQGLYVDQTGIWSNDLLVVCGADEALSGTNLNIWRIHSQTSPPQLVAAVPTSHLEGVLTLSNDSRYGPWAGKLLTGDENQHAIYAVETNGDFTPYFLGIDPDTFRLIPTNQDLYCVNFRSDDSSHSQIIKLTQTYLSPFISDILIVQAGEVPPDFPALFIVHWNGIRFETHSISLNDYFPSTDFFEKAAFAPISLPPIPQ